MWSGAGAGLVVDPFKLTRRTAITTAAARVDDKYMAAAFVANLIRYKQEGYGPTATSSWRWRRTRKSSTPTRSASVADQEPPRPDRRRIRPQRGRRRRPQARQGDPQQRPDQREGPVILPARGTQQGRPLLGAAPGQRDLPSRGRSRAARQVRFSAQPNATTRHISSAPPNSRPRRPPPTSAAVLAAKPDPAALARLSETLSYNAQLRTTCVATMMQGGHAFNALPQTGAGHRQLPDHAEREGRGRQGDARARARRRPDRGARRPTRGAERTVGAQRGVTSHHRDRPSGSFGPARRSSR